MKTVLGIGGVLIAGALLIPAVVPAQSGAPEFSNVSHSVPAPTTDSDAEAIEELVYAKRFVLDEGFESFWSKARPTVTTGTLAVVRVNPELVFPHEAATPVLYAGNQTAERVNIGYPDGMVVIIVPGDTDLTTQPIWFGSADFPERITADKIAGERHLAERAGITAATATQASAAKAQGGTAILHVTDKVELLREAALLINDYAPSETELAEILLATPARH